MGVFTYVCRKSGGEWNGKQINGGELEASAASTYDLQRKLVHTSLSADSSGGVQSSFSLITPTSAVFLVIIGGAVGGGFIGGGSAPSAPSGGGGAPAAEASPAEEKKEEKEESDDDMGFSLFD